MSGFEPGPGWREVPYVEYRDDALAAEQTATVRVGDQDPRYFIREQPTPPLPTEPYTVIRVGARALIRLPEGWHDLVLNSQLVRGIETQITGFEVLAEPRAVTAKAVLDTLARANWDTSARVIDAIDRDFGVES